ncbi:MAG: TetR/AcrR family transcriptional regulator [Erysipelotrichaceae bacterium]|nr:TetR/AcrR family transcriptional regulator [Erysipelotrichaceae bacterium]
MNKKDEIINACIHLISQKGLDLSSMQNIATEVGLTKSTLYFYFDSKDSLLKEVYNYCHDRDALACNEGIAECNGAIEKLLKRFENIIAYAMNNTDMAKVEGIFEVAPQFQNEVANAHKDFLNDILSIVEEGVENKEIKEMPSWLLAQTYFGFCEVMYKRFIANPELWEDESIKTYCKEIIINILKKEEN